MRPDPIRTVGRVLGIDYGERRIGLALSDPTQTIAGPLPPLRRRTGKRPPLATLVEIAHREKVGSIVVGLPLSPAGSETEWTAEVRRVGEELGKRLGLPIHFVDERFTSAAGARAVRSLGLTKSAREEKERVDTAAAILILQGWLDRRPAP